MKTLAKNITTIFGKPGAQWLARLPEQINSLAQQLQLTDITPCANMSHNYIAHAMDQHQHPVILKCGLPGKDFAQSVTALKAYQGHGAINVLQDDAAAGWSLLESCEPGATLLTLPTDDLRSEIICTLIQMLHSTEPDKDLELPTLREWIEALDKLEQKPPNYIEKKHIDYAKDAAADLIAHTTNPTLLHGDLHHENILSAKREPWLAIDPKGVIGDTAFEFSAMLVNPPSILTQHNLPKLTKKRLDIITSITNYDHKHILLWGFIAALIRVQWFLSDNLTANAKDNYHLCHVFFELVYSKYF